MGQISKATTDTKVEMTTKVKTKTITDMTGHARTVGNEVRAKMNVGPKEVDEKAKYLENITFKDHGKTNVHTKPLCLKMI